MRLPPAIGLFCLFLTASALQGATRLDFNRDIRPVLSDNCFACHGIDKKRRKAELRLDVADGGVFSKNKDGLLAINAGDPAGSELIKRITTTVADDLMPPADSHKKLTAPQIDMLKRWIAEGAGYKKHWAFEPIAKPVVPATAGKLSTVDQFIVERLTESGLSFSPPASPEQLLRRVTFDLTGLPPTPEEVDAFIADQSPDAYERVVDRLLRSPHYGEHIGRYWLDAARYGDTHGLHLDNERSMWPYRDWVVRAFNDNLSFDKFTVWQVAGDLISNATPDQVVASGFNRCNVTTGEGGAINEEWLFRYAVDRTDATISVWMGLTGGCAVCHDHKYDPLSQKEFYSMYAFFNSAADPGMDGNILLTQPTIKLSTADQNKQLAALDGEIAARQAKIHDAIAGLKYSDPASQKPPPPVQTSEVVWFEDGFPPGVKAESVGGPTTFVTKEQGPVFSGGTALKRKGKGVVQDFFAGGASFTIPPNGRISVQCYIDPADKPKSVMLQFHVGGWNHRAVWGEEGAIPFGQVRTNEHVYLGAMPEAGKWGRLEFPIEKLGLKPGMVVTGYAFTQFDGTVYWDHLSMNSRVDPAKDPLWWWS